MRAPVSQCVCLVASINICVFVFLVCLAVARRRSDMNVKVSTMYGDVGGLELLPIAGDNLHSSRHDETLIADNDDALEETEFETSVRQQSEQRLPSGKRRITPALSIITNENG